MRISNHLIFCGILATTAACSGPVAPVLGQPLEVSVPAEGETLGPRLTSGPDGHLALSWLEHTGSGPSLRFSRVTDTGFSRGNEIVVEPRMFVNWADLPSVMQVEGQHWIAHWLRYSADKTYSYDVVVSQSFDDGRTWTEGITAHTDGTPTEHGFVSMHRDADGVALLWLDGRNTPDAPMTLRSAVITPDERRLREQLVDDSVCDCCQTDMAVSATGPLAVYRDRSADETRDIYITRHADGAWEPGARLFDDDWVIAGCPVNGPSIVARDNHVAVAWFSAANNTPTVRVVTSANGGATFGAPTEIATGRIAGYVGLALLDDQSLAVSWVARSPSGDNTLLLRRVTAEGIAQPVHTIADIAQLRVFPQLGYQDDSLYLVWTDEIDGASAMSAVRVPVSLP